MTSLFDYLKSYTVSLHVEAQNLMQELKTFEEVWGDQPRFVDARARLALTSLDERRHLCFKQAMIEDSRATAYGSRHSESWWHDHLHSGWRCGVLAATVEGICAACVFF